MTEFGRSMLGEWHLDPALTYLNHGTVGATPKRVLQRQRDIIDEIERHPADFMLRRLADPHLLGSPELPLMRQAAGTVADFVGADVDGLALVDNITTGANAVLRSIDFEPGDAIAVTSHGYGGVTNVVRHVARRAGAEVYEVDLPRPGAAVDAFVAAVQEQLRPGTRLAVVDHISSSSALILPIAEIVQVCREAAVPIFVDGAHVPGQLDLDVASLQADWYCANLHKWGWTPRSSGFLWVAPEHRATTHAAVTSWGLDNGLAAEFDLPGTRDPSGFLAIPEAFAMRAELGEGAIRTYNHELAWAAAERLSARWEVPFTTPREMVGSMVVVDLPARLGASADAAGEIRQRLHDDSGIELPVFSAETESGRCATASLAVRVSTQIYNDLDDIDRLADAVLSLP